MVYTFVILNAIFLLATVVLCSIVIPILVQDEKTKKVTKNFLLSLCISDLVRVVLGSGFLIRTGIGLKVSDECLCEVTLFGISLVAGLLVTVVTSLNRYFAVCYPIKYETIMNEKLSYAVIGVNWLFVLIIGSMFAVFRESVEELKQEEKATSCVHVQFVVEKDFLAIFTLGVILPSIVVIVITNIKIYCAMKRVYTTTSNRTTLTFWVKTQFDDGKRQGSTKCGPLKRREVRATLILLLTVTIFAVIWIPVICFRMVQVFGNLNKLSETWVYTIYTLIQTHSVINPFLYIFTIKHHKKAFTKLLARVLCCRTEAATVNENQMDNEST